MWPWIEASYSLGIIITTFFLLLYAHWRSLFSYVVAYKSSLIAFCFSEFSSKSTHFRFTVSGLCLPQNCLHIFVPSVLLPHLSDGLFSLFQSPFLFFKAFPTFTAHTHSYMHININIDLYKYKSTHTDTDTHHS